MAINPKQATTEITPSENTTDGWRALLEMFECANAQFKESTALSQLTKETVERVLKTVDLMQRTRPHKKNNYLSYINRNSSNNRRLLW